MGPPMSADTTTSALARLARMLREQGGLMATLVAPDAGRTRSDSGAPIAPVAAPVQLRDIRRERARPDGCLGATGAGAPP